MGKRELVALLCLSFCCLVIVVLLFLTMPLVYLQYVIVVFPDHALLLFYFGEKHQYFAIYTGLCFGRFFIVCSLSILIHGDIMAISHHMMHFNRVCVVHK